MEAWLNANCSQWEPAGVTSGTFEGDDSGVICGGENQKRHKNVSSAKFAMLLAREDEQALKCSRTARRPRCETASRSTS
jgi:hypothetical protein